MADLCRYYIDTIYMLYIYYIYTIYIYYIYTIYKLYRYYIYTIYTVLIMNRATQDNFAQSYFLMQLKNIKKNIAPKSSMLSAREVLVHCDELCRAIYCALRAEPSIVCVRVCTSFYSAVPKRS